MTTEKTDYEKKLRAYQRDNMHWDALSDLLTDLCMIIWPHGDEDSAYSPEQAREKFGLIVERLQDEELNPGQLDDAIEESMHP